MPSWVVHLATANEVLKEIKVEDKNSFLIGNIIPDAERHVVKDFSICVPYSVTHFSEIRNIDGKIENFPNIDKFMKKYKNYLYNSMVLGYLTHILTDYFWNKSTYFKYTIRDNDGNCIGLKLNNGSEIKCGIKERSKIKHRDFNIFKNYIGKKGDYVIPKYEDKLLQDLKLIKDIPFTKEDINKIITYLNEKKFDENVGEYSIFTKSKINQVYKDCISFIVDFIKNIDI